MFDIAGQTFFSAMRDAVERVLGRAHPCHRVIERAARSDDPTVTEAAQDELNRLEPDVLEALMAETHRLLRENPAAILGEWGDPGRGRPN